MDDFIDMNNPLWLKLGLPLLVLLNGAWIGIGAQKLLEAISRNPRIRKGTTSLLHGLSAPIKWLIWGSALLFVFYLAAKEGGVDLEPLHPLQIARLFLLAMVTWIAFRWKSTYEMYLIKAYESTSKEKLALATAIGRLITILITVISFLIFLDILHIPIGALLAFGGVGGLAVGLAAQGLIANLFGGLMIHINRHFAIGDWIYSPNKQFEGIVEEVGWYQTRIRTLERRPTFIPNSLLTDAIIENPGRMYNRRIKTKVSLTYEDMDKVESIVKELEKMLKEHTEIDQKQQLQVSLVDFAPSSIDLEIYCFTKSTTFTGFRLALQDVLLKVARIVEKQGAKMAYPTSTVHLLKEEGTK